MFGLFTKTESHIDGALRKPEIASNLAQLSILIDEMRSDIGTIGVLFCPAIRMSFVCEYDTFEGTIFNIKLDEHNIMRLALSGAGDIHRVEFLADLTKEEELKFIDKAFINAVEYFVDQFGQRYLNRDQKSDNNKIKNAIASW